MIATLSVILFIESETSEITGNKILQKGDAISKTSAENYQIYRYTLFTPVCQADSPTDQKTNDDENIQPFELHAVYLVYGKFASCRDGSLDVSVTSHIRLEISPDDLPVCMPFVHLLGRTQNIPIKTDVGYQVDLQVKPYLNKEQCGTFTISLVHPPDGRFKNALEQTRKFSLVHTMGTLMFHKNKLFCDILEYQFVSTKRDDSSNIIIPWKQSTSTGESSESVAVQSSLEKRIVALEKNIQEIPPLPTATKRIAPPTHEKGKGKRPRIADIACDILKRSKDFQHSDDNEEIKEHSESNIVESQDAPTPTINPNNTAETQYSQGSGKRGRPKRQCKASRV
jgi:hypothetical protein